MSTHNNRPAIIWHTHCYEYPKELGAAVICRRIASLRTKNLRVFPFRDERLISEYETDLKEDKTMTFRWKESFSVNVENMDHQHQKFIALVAELNEVAEKQNIDDARFRELFRGMSSYAARHFQEEENLLASVDFPDLDQQRRHHQFFIDELGRLEDKFCRGDKAAVRGMVGFLRDWLFSHILMEDRKYAATFQEQPRTPPSS